MSEQLFLQRRHLLIASGAGAVTAVTGNPAAARAAQQATGNITQPDTPGDAAFVERAFEMRKLAVEKGDQAYGAVIVRDGVIIGQSWSRVILGQDPTGHAEIAAIRDAAHRTSSHDLAGALMYYSSRPCPMCEAAAFWAGIGQMIHGRNATSAGAPGLCR